MLHIFSFGGRLTRFDPENGLIYGFVKPTLPEELNGKFNSDYASVSYQPTCRYMGTGSTVTLSYDGRQSVYTAVVFGDVNGDAWYDGQDKTIVNCIIGGMLTEENVGEAVYTAADCNHDGVIDALDADILEQAGVLLANVDQSKDADELMTSSAFAEYISLIDQNPVIEQEDDAVAETDTDGDIEEPASKSFIDYIKGFFEKLINFIASLSNLIFSFIKYSV